MSECQPSSAVPGRLRKSGVTKPEPGIFLQMSKPHIPISYASLCAILMRRPLFRFERRCDCSVDHLCDNDSIKAIAILNI